MTRIGFAYNQKPDTGEGASQCTADLSCAEDPPSSRRDAASRTFTPPPAASRAGRRSDISASDDRYAEWDSLQTIDAVAAALGAFGEVIRLEATAEFPERLRAAAPDIVFNIAEGLSGANREAHVPAICEFLDVPYSGSDPFTLSLCLDKARTKEVLSYHQVPTAPFVVVHSPAELRPIRLGHTTLRPPSQRAPLFIKPLHEGSSKGITERCVVRSAAQLEREAAALLESYEQPVLVESFLTGAEFTCGVLGNGSSARVLPLVSINFDALPPGALPIYGFEAKWVWDTADRPLEIFECPAHIAAELRAAIEGVVLRAYKVLGCRDWARIDVRLDAAGVPNVVEVNPLPGILPDPADNSCLPKAARAAGIAYDALIQRCLLHAAERCGVPLADQPRFAGVQEAVA